MKSELAEEIFALIESRSQARPTAMEFEMAYQTRVAMDRIRFAIKHTEQFAPRTDQMRDVGVQLLDALQRLEVADRRFQRRCGFESVAAEQENNLDQDDLLYQTNIQPRKKDTQTKGIFGKSQ